MIEATKGPVLPKQSLREWVLQQRRSARSAEAVDRFSEVLKELDTLARQRQGQSAKVDPQVLKALDALTQNKPVRSVTVDNPLPPPPGATPELEAVASAEDAAGDTMEQVASTRPRQSWTRRNVLRRKASPIVKRSAKEERNQREQRVAPAKAAKKARKGGRPQRGAIPMTPAERVKAYRERKKAEAAKKGGKARRGRPKK